MLIGILGTLEVRVGSTVVAIRRGMPRTILATLALHAPAPVSTDRLMELLWGADQPQNPSNALQVQISYLRKALSAAQPGSTPIATLPGAYALVIDPDDVDAKRFERLLGEARREAESTTWTHRRRALELLDEALGLWRGEALADVVDTTFATGEVIRLSELRLGALETRVELQLAMGRHREVVGELVRLVDEHPLREGLREQLMLALYRSGRQGDALRAYDAARSALVEELGVDPGPRLQRLAQEILEHAPALDWAPPPDLATSSSVLTGRDERRRRRAAPPLTGTPIIGRDAELDRLEQLLDVHRSVTLTGPGGAGKSRMALELAARRMDGLDVAYVDLGALVDERLVAPSVAAVLGIPTSPEEDPALAVARALEGDELLLVLDTCEHVLQGVGVLVSTLLSSAAGVRVLSTSRRPLGVAGEIAWPVPPLATAPPGTRDRATLQESPAVRLFVERAEAIRPGFALDDANAADVAAICSSLDGLPLAIELAAARADVLTPAAIRSRLDDRFALLVDGDVDVAPRQRTLRAAIDWSYALLAPQERVLFARLSVFAGSFHLDAALALEDADLPDPMGALIGLVRHSVAMVVGNDRYRLLDSLRTYAAEHLGEAPEVRLRHAEHYRAVAEHIAGDLRGFEQLDALERFRQDLPNLRAAVGWAFERGSGELAAGLVASVVWPWTLSGMSDEALQMLERAEGLSAVPAELGVANRASHAMLAASLGDLDRARELGEEAVDRAQRLADPRSWGVALNALGVAQWALGDLDGAAESQDGAIACYQAAGEFWGVAASSALRARTAVDRSEFDAGVRARAALDDARRTGDHAVVGLALEQLARIELAGGDLESAATLAHQCLAEHSAIGSWEGVTAALHVLGRVSLLRGDHGEAGALHRRALSLAVGIHHPGAVGDALEELARVAAADGEPGEALRLLTLAAKTRASVGSLRRATGARSVDSLRAQLERALGGEASNIQLDAGSMPVDEAVRLLLASEAASTDAKGA